MEQNKHQRVFSKESVKIYIKHGQKLRVWSLDVREKLRKVIFIIIKINVLVTNKTICRAKERTTNMKKKKRRLLSIKTFRYFFLAPTLDNRIRIRSTRINYRRRCMRQR